MPEPLHLRVRKRLPCTVRAGRDRHPGITLNLSEGGLFVQTDAGSGVGSRVELELSPSPAGAIPVQASVVWRKAVPRSLRGVSHSGLGVRIDSAPPTYQALVAALLRERSLAARPGGDSACAAFRVRLRLLGTPRSRTVVVVSHSEEEARRTALEQQGGGWSVLDLDRMT